MTIATSKTMMCDEDGCNNNIAEAVSSNKEMRKFVRKWGWACHSGGDYCPIHNSKE